MWVTINTLQLLRYIPMFSLYLSRSIFLFLSYINVVNLENDVLEEIYLVHIPEDQLSHKNLEDYRFTSQGVESSSILMHCADIFALLILMSVYYLFVYIVSVILRFRKGGQVSSAKDGCPTPNTSVSNPVIINPRTGRPFQLHNLHLSEGHVIAEVSSHSF